MRTWMLVAVVAMALAGCSEPPQASPSAIHPGPTPAGDRQDHFEVDVHVFTPGGCTGSICAPEGSAETLYTPYEDQAIRSAVFTIGAALGASDPVEWILGCAPLHEEDPSCASPLAQGNATLPFDVRFDGPALTPGARLVLHLGSKTKVAPGPQGLLYNVQQLRSHVSGSVSLGTRVPLGPGSYGVESVSFDGDSGPCVPVAEPTCQGYPGGTRLQGDEQNNTVIGVNLTMTWTSTGPADRELVLFVYQSQCSKACPPYVEAQGASPLHLTGDRARLRDPTIIIETADPTGHEPTGFLFDYTGTRTPVHVEGVFTTLADPPEV